MVAALQREEQYRYLNGLLEISRFRDYCPNGLQVEGRGEIRRIVSAVTASIDLIQAALTDGPYAILAHDVDFWNGDDACLTGICRTLRAGAPVRRHSKSGANLVPVRVRAKSFFSFLSAC